MQTERQKRESWKCQRLQWNLTYWHIRILVYGTSSGEECVADRVREGRHLCFAGFKPIYESLYLKVASMSQLKPGGSKLSITNIRLQQTYNPVLNWSLQTEIFKYPLFNHKKVDWHRGLTNYDAVSLYGSARGESRLRETIAQHQPRAEQKCPVTQVQWAYRLGHTPTWLSRSYPSPGQSQERRAVFLDLKVKSSHHIVSLCHFIFLPHMRKSVIAVLSSISTFEVCHNYQFMFFNSPSLQNQIPQITDLDVT